MMSRFFFLILCQLVLHESSHAQRRNFQTTHAQEELNRVQDQITSLDYPLAVKSAAKLTRKYPDWPEAWLLTARIQRENGRSSDCERALIKVIALDSTGYPEAYRWLSDHKFNTGFYKESKDYLTHYYQLSAPSSRNSWKDSLLFASIQFAIDEVQGNSATAPVKLPTIISSVDEEYFPSLTADGSLLVFTRLKHRITDKNAPGYDENLYSATWKAGGFTNVGPFSFPITTPYNEGTQTLRQDGRIMIFTACNRSDTKGGCDLYLSIKSGEIWGQPINLDYPVNTRYWESTPCLSPDGRSLLFSSNRPGGKGGMDLWKSEWQTGGTWSAPQNLGLPINSPGDEMSPLYDSDPSLLYFVSTGHVGMGGFDLFMTRQTTGRTWSEPINLGYPINTWANEDGLAISGTRDSAIIGSDRDSSTGRDLYWLSWGRKRVASYSLAIRGTVRDRKTGSPLVAWVDVQPTGDSMVSRVDSDPVNGSFLLGIPRRGSYRLAASAPGFMPYSKNILTADKESVSSIVVDIFLDQLDEGSTVILQNIFFKVDSHELLPDSQPDLLEMVRFILENPRLTFEIRGHTDATGGKEYNLQLSQRRAESVRDYLILKGVPPERLLAKGLGASLPVAGNDTEAGRSSNRRTELRVISQR